MTPSEIQEWWKRYGKLSPERARELRRQMQTDLFFLTKSLGYFDITERTHREVAEFFVQKNPDITSFREFALQDTDLHWRDLFLPRNGFKSSFNNADMVQWIVCWPNITILDLTGVLDLSKDFLSELTGHFTLTKDGAPRQLKNGQSSLFQILFPEHCVLPKTVKALEFTTPARTDTTIKEPTVLAKSIGQTLPGWHFDILKLDDVVTNENTKTPERMKTVRRDVSISRAMMNPYGYFDKIGTWYDENDIYGDDIIREERGSKTGDEPMVKILLRGSMIQKPASAEKPLEDLTEQDWDLWFPERLTYKFLMLERKLDPEGFPIKYMNDPRAIHQVSFNRDRMVNQTRDRRTLPLNGIVFSSWDTAYKTNRWNDYTVGIAALFVNGNVVILDMVRGKFNEYELPRVIAAFLAKWKPMRTAIEDAPGVIYLKRAIRDELDKQRVQLPIEYVNLGRGSITKNKANRAKPLSRLLLNNRLFFSKECPELETIYDELEGFLGRAKNDDIVDAMSLLVNHFISHTDIAMMESNMALMTPTPSNYKERLKEDLYFNMGLEYFPNHAICGRAPVDDVFSVDTPQGVVDDYDFMQD